MMVESVVEIVLEVWNLGGESRHITQMHESGGVFSLIGDIFKRFIPVGGMRTLSLRNLA